MNLFHDFEKQITFTPGDYGAGEYQITYYEGGQTKAPLYAHFAAYMVMAIGVERAIRFQRWREQGAEGMPPALSAFRVNDPAMLKAIEVNHFLRDAFLATRWFVQQLNVAPHIDPPHQAQASALGQIPPWLDPSTLLKVTCVSTAGIVASTFWGMGRNEKWAEVSKFEAETAAQVAMYAKQLEAAAAMGAPLPAPPKSVAAIAAEQRSSTTFGLVVGGVLLAGAGYGIHRAMKKPKRRRNPAPVAPRRARRRLLRSKATRKAKATATKRRVSRKAKNPLSSGHSQATVSKNIAKLIGEGMPPHQASAAALRSARASWRTKHKTKAFPAHLKPKKAAKKNPRKKAAKKAPARRKVTVRKKAAKKNPRKKAAAKKKANPNSKAAFLRRQKRKGRSDKQAAADWKAKQRLKKIRPKGKARRRR